MMLNGRLPGLAGPTKELQFEAHIAPDHVIHLVVKGCNSARHANVVAEWIKRSLGRHVAEIGFVSPDDFRGRLILPAGMKPKQ